MNSSNSGTRGCDAGPSRVSANLSVHKAYKNIIFIFMYFTTLQLVNPSLWDPDILLFWRLQVSCSSEKMVALETKGFLMVSHLIILQLTCAFLLHLILSDPADQMRISLSNGHAPSHGHLICDFSVWVKSLFWLILSVKENVPNNYAHLNIRRFHFQSSCTIIYPLNILDTKWIVVIKLNVVLNW